MQQLVPVELELQGRFFTLLGEQEQSGSVDMEIKGLHHEELWVRVGTRVRKDVPPGSAKGLLTAGSDSLPDSLPVHTER